MVDPRGKKVHTWKFGLGFDTDVETWSLQGIIRGIFSFQQL